MSLLIPGKKMPERCGKCPVFERIIEQGGSIPQCRLLFRTETWGIVDDHLRDADCPLVEVTHCRDCRFWNMTMPEDEREKAAENPLTDGVCEYHMSDGFSPNDFCSNARAREAET